MLPEFRLIDLIGAAGALVFYSRFYVQLYYSERAGKSTSPAIFWYLSSIGSVSLFLYGVLLQSPLGVLAHCFNVVIYARNLVHIWREHGSLTRSRRTAANVAIAVSVIAAVTLLAYTWFGEFQQTRDAHPKEAITAWLWILLGVGGQVLFACRFMLQWAVTEARRKSTFPMAFWYISIVASVLQILAFGSRGEWVYALGLLSTLPVYVRNIWLHRRPDTGEATEPGEAVTS
jgi:lipid-A-disaccharide synthase-like uncharacterized protein